MPKKRTSPWFTIRGAYKTLSSVRELIRRVEARDSNWVSLHDWVLDRGGNGERKRELLLQAGWLKAKLAKLGGTAATTPSQPNKEPGHIWFSPDLLESIQKGTGGTPGGEGMPEFRSVWLPKEPGRKHGVESIQKLVAEIGEKRYWGLVARESIHRKKRYQIEGILEREGWRKVKLPVAVRKGSRIAGRRKAVFWMSPYKKKTG